MRPTIAQIDAVRQCGSELRSFIWYGFPYLLSDMNSAVSDRYFMTPRPSAERFGLIRFPAGSKPPRSARADTKSHAAGTVGSAPAPARGVAPKHQAGLRTHDNHVAASARQHCEGMGAPQSPECGRQADPAGGQCGDDIAAMRKAE